MMKEENSQTAYSVSMGAWNAVFAVPVCAVDEHMKLAGAAQLKVLLYMLRHAGEEITLDRLAFAIGQKPSDTKDALDYWINCGLLGHSLSAGRESVAETSNAPAVPESREKAETLLPEVSVRNALGEAPEKKAPVAREKIRYPFDECMRFVAEDSQLKNMLTAVESTLGKQLNHTEVSCFVTLVRWHGLPCSVVPMLVQYCKSIGKPGMSYIEATGIGWTSEEIDTFEKAEKKITALTSRRRAWTIVRNALEIPERKATDSELKYCDLWINAQHIEVDLIRHAYDKCVNKHGKMHFGYMNGILKRYYDQGITDVVSALKLDEQQREAMEARRAARGDTSGGNQRRGRYEETSSTEDIEAVLDQEWESEVSQISGDYNYDD